MTLAALTSGPGADVNALTSGPGADVKGATIRAFEASLPMALMRAREAVMRHFRPILADHDVTEQQWRVLRALNDATTPISVGELAERTFLLGPSLSRMLSSLDERGMIDRAAGDDARRAEISISTAGQELVAQIAPLSEAAYEQIEHQLEPGELDQLADLLNRLAAPAAPTTSADT
jgi:homoprotocatechuate degradation regulator HpaR